MVADRLQFPGAVSFYSMSYSILVQVGLPYAGAANLRIFASFLSRYGPIRLFAYFLSRYGPIRLFASFFIGIRYAKKG
jgi:hypothetical protein